MDLASILRGMLAYVEAEEAAQNSKGDVKSYTNRGDGSQNITGSKNNSGEKAGDRTYYKFITYNYSSPAKKKTPPRNKTSNMPFDTNKSPHLNNSLIFYEDTPTFHGDSNGNIHQNLIFLKNNRGPPPQNKTCNPTRKSISFDVKNM
ncbi:hypothetical protein PHAVU_006G116800 [Phaseolus vulgaris]|uniref:Uncharacterized protein n=1 Tax=Phaseolus vulgaris TaxID=3885 RepID=V7BRZ4_PHAVU|nr:hypothetical protein PHAVU_006G116800g [Phaseolus vulgaris]ESW19346.1 hypothetical protein PHAVU_006G116800g [Phaseolus vulgaris]